MTQTIPQLFEETVQKFPNNTYLLQKAEGVYKPSSYVQVREKVYHFACGLLSAGLKKGERVSLLAEGCNNWVISELGVIYAGAINVPLSIKLTDPQELIFRLQHSGTKILITSKRQADKVFPVLDKLPDLEKVIYFDHPGYEHPKTVLFNDVLSEGKAYFEKNASEFHDLWNSFTNDDYVNICYTSGTTADPKGIILSHRNYTANVEQACNLMDVPEWYSTLLILPWDHAFAHTCGIYTLMKAGASLASIDLGDTPMETLKNIPKNIKEVQPSFLLSVPALAKNFKKNILKGIKDKGPTVEKLFNHALNVAIKYNGIGWDRGNGLRIFLKPLYWLYDKILFSKIREGFGGKLKFFVGGGALLDIDLQRFFYAIGIPMFQGYGLSEAAPVISSNSEKKHKMGSSGYLVDNLELKICDDDGAELPAGEKGEIVVRGENVMKGYWNNESATNEALKGDWLHTGDLGYMDADGFLYVLGRFKSLLIADDGEKYSPEGIEEALVEHSKFVEQCMLYNNQGPYTVALIVPNKEALKNYVASEGLSLQTEDGHAAALKKIEGELQKFKTGGEYEGLFPQRWLPASVGVLSEGFTEDNHLLNSTLKIVRPKITERYQELIDFLYTPEAKNITNKRNITFVNELIN